MRTAVAGILSVSSNPLITTAKFTIADDLPNNNKQGVPFDEFEAIAASMIGMPVKINFVDDWFEGTGSTNHPGAYPIGHISNTEIIDNPDGSHQLIGYASIWNEEFPREVAWLKQKMQDAEAGKSEAPGLSWELKYRESSKDAAGIEWLKGIVAQAATFVKFPAYGARTSLLALASIQDPEDNKEEITKVLIAIAEQLAPKQPKIEGGNQMTEEEAKQLREAEASAQKEVERLLGVVAEKEKEVTDLSEKVASLERAALTDTRVKKYTELVGALPEAEAEANAKKAFLLSFNDDQFDAMLTELAALKKAATPLAPAPSAAEAARQAMASLRVPKLESSSDTPNLRADLKALARPNSV